MSGISHIPAPLLAATIGATGIAAALAMLLLWHALRRLFDWPRVPRSFGAYMLLVLFAAIFAAAGLAGLTLVAAMADWNVLTDGPIGEARCVKIDLGAGGGQLELTFVPLASDGRPGVEEKVVATGGGCEISGQILRLAPALHPLGLHAVHRVTKLGTVVRRTTLPMWRALPRPFGIDIGGVHHEAVMVPVTRDTWHRLRVRGDGYWLETVTR